MVRVYRALVVGTAFAAGCAGWSLQDHGPNSGKYFEKDSVHQEVCLAGATVPAQAAQGAQPEAPVQAKEPSFQELRDIRRYFSLKQGEFQTRTTESRESGSRYDRLLQETIEARNDLKTMVDGMKEEVRKLNPDYVSHPTNDERASIESEIQNRLRVLSESQTPAPEAETSDPITALFSDSYQRARRVETLLGDVTTELGNLLTEQKSLSEEMRKYGVDVKGRVDTYLERRSTEWKQWFDELKLLEQTSGPQPSGTPGPQQPEVQPQTPEQPPQPPSQPEVVPNPPQTPGPQEPTSPGQ